MRSLSRARRSSTLCRKHGARGQGALYLAFEQLKKKLAAEGLFAEDRKLPLPFLPASIGIVSPTKGRALAAFERGVGLVKYCNQKLTEVEKKVELLVKDKEGKLQFKALVAVTIENSDEDGV